jgi:hypothetical protein
LEYCGNFTHYTFHFPQPWDMSRHLTAVAGKEDSQYSRVVSGRNAEAGHKKGMPIAQ